MSKLKILTTPQLPRTKIAQLNAQLEEHMNQRRSPPSLSVHSVSDPAVSPSSRECRKGRVSPIDKFSGESPEVRLDDWLLSLQRAVSWNTWTEEERFI